VGCPSPVGGGPTPAGVQCHRLRRSDSDQLRCSGERLSLAGWRRSHSGHLSHGYSHQPASAWQGCSIFGRPCPDRGWSVYHRALAC
jgi:hypothetical protein